MRMKGDGGAVWSDLRKKIFLAYENSSESRCAYLLPVAQYSWNESIEKIYDFFAQNEVNKRQLMASRRVDLQLPGNYDYQRILHSDDLSWVDKIKYCMQAGSINQFQWNFDYYLTWMSFQLSHRIFLFFIWSRSPLRSLTKSKSILHDSRKFIAS